MKKHDVILIGLILILCAGFYWLYSATLGSHKADIAKMRADNAAQVKELTDAQDNLAAQYMELDKKHLLEIAALKGKANDLQTDIDAHKTKTTAEVEHLKNSSVAWEVKYQTLAEWYDEAKAEIDRYAKLTLTLRDQIKEQDALLASKDNYIGDLSKLMDSCTGQLKVALDKQVGLQQRINSLTTLGKIETIAGAGLLVYFIVRMVAK